MRLRPFGAAFLAASLVAGARSEVVRFDIVSRTPLAGGAGGERIEARATIALDPGAAANRAIADLARAPRDASGRVEATADVLILRPAGANGTLLLELPNRGHGQIYGALDDMRTAEAMRPDSRGSGFTLDRGYTLVLVGWQGDVARGSGLGLAAPVVRGLTGPSRDQWTFSGDAAVERATLSWPVADRASARFAVRARPDAPLGHPPGTRWRFLDDRTIEIRRPAGRRPGERYELLYTARDPVVMGMGFAAIRDVGSFLRHDGSAMNPLARAGRSTISATIATGISQDGRALRDYLYQGFNADEHGHIVFDGMLPIIPGTRRSFTNARFAQPGRNPGPEADQLFPVDQFPFTYGAGIDRLTGKRDGLLLHCAADATCPKIMELDSEYEFYGSRASLLVTDTRGQAIALPPNVRAYMLAGAPHYNDAFAVSARDPRCTLSSSPVAAGPAIRVLLVDLEQWVRNGTPPPASRYPSVADGTLVPAREVYPTGLPLPYRGQHLHARLVVQTPQGPVVKGEYPVLLPKADADGNALAGIRLPEVAVPRATYVGWNPQAGFDGPQDLCDHAAGMVPFAADPQGRAAGDHRPSLAERYPQPGDYARKIRVAAARLVADRLLLPADAAAAIAKAD